MQYSWFVVLLLFLGCTPESANQENNPIETGEASEDQSTYYPDYDYSDAFYSMFYERFDPVDVSRITGIPVNQLKIEGTLSREAFEMTIQDRSSAKRYLVILSRQEDAGAVAHEYDELKKRNSSLEDLTPGLVEREHVLDVPGDVEAYWSDTYGMLRVFLHRSRFMQIRTMAPVLMAEKSDVEKQELEASTVALATYYLNQF